MRYGTEHGFYELNRFPGCNQLVVSNHAFVKAEFRGKGFGQKAHEERLAEATRLGYDGIICTCREDNARQIHILSKNGWIKVWSFRSTETNHAVGLWTRELNVKTSV